MMFAPMFVISPASNNSMERVKIIFVDTEIFSLFILEFIKREIFYFVSTVLCYVVGFLV